MKPDGIVEDVMDTLYFLEYLVDFVIISPKATLGGYPIILGRPWLVTLDDFIACCSEK